MITLRKAAALPVGDKGDLLSGFGQGHANQSADSVNSENAASHEDLSGPLFLISSYLRYEFWFSEIKIPALSSRRNAANMACCALLGPPISRLRP